MMSKVIALANHKGGVCKTTLTLSIADALAREGMSVLVVDMDPQANATRLAYSFDEAPAVTVEKVLEGSASLVEAIIHETRIDGVHLLGSTLKLANLEREMTQTPFFSTTSLLHEKLKAAQYSRVTTSEKRFARLRRVRFATITSVS
jgi:chromosome partitioning protein